MTKTLGLDSSKWQGVMNWQKARDRMSELNANGQAFAIARAGSINDITSNCYYDDMFYNNVDGMAEFMDEYGFYWFFRPNHSPSKQAAYFKMLLEDEYGSFKNLDWGYDDHGVYFVWNGKKVRIWLDVEADGGLYPTQITDAIVAFFDYFLGNEANLTGLYSRANWLNAHTVFVPEFILLALWIARYDTSVDHPWLDNPAVYKPRDWDNYTLWQFSAGGNSRGAEFGAQSTSIDLNYLNGELIPLVPTGDDEMSEVLDKLDLVLAKLDVIQQTLDAEPEPLPDPPPETDPPPVVESGVVKITDEKANMRFQTVDSDGLMFDKEGKPIFQIYPSDSSLVKDRIQFFKGSVLEVNKDKVTASGGETFYKLLTKFGRGNETLYVWTKECMKLW